MKLNIGCGKDIKKGYINLDCAKLPGVNVVHDLEKFPYPFKDSVFEEVLCFHVLEHMGDMVKVVEELYRITKKNGILKVKVPYFNNHLAFVDPTHKHFFTMDSFNYYVEGEKFSYYSKARFEIVKKHLKGTIFGSLIPHFMRNFIGLFFGNIGEEIYFELRVLK